MVSKGITGNTVVNHYPADFESPQTFAELILRGWEVRRWYYFYLFLDACRFNGGAMRLAYRPKDIIFDEIRPHILDINSIGDWGIGDLCGVNRPCVFANYDPWFRDSSWFSGSLEQKDLCNVEDMGLHDNPSVISASVQLDGHFKKGKGSRITSTFCALAFDVAYRMALPFDKMPEHSIILRMNKFEPVTPILLFWLPGLKQKSKEDL